MKKVLLGLALVVMLVSCEQQAPTADEVDRVKQERILEEGRGKQVCQPSIIFKKRNY